MEKKETEVLFADKFENMLDKDEKIVKVFKPNKTKFFFANLFFAGITFLVFTLLGVLVFLCPEEGYEPSVLGAVLCVAGYVFVMLVFWLLAYVYYKNLFYAYTNKRVIVRSGIFGVDYKSLDMAMIGAVDVYVSLLDKMLRKNTGTIAFGSMASPMYHANGGSSYRFSHVVMPYETCREIKETIDEYKNKK